MAASYRYWAGMLSGFFLFILVFIHQKMGTITVAEPEFPGKIGLLLFVIPGFIASNVSRGKCILCALLGALYALPISLMILHFWLAEDYSFWQELAYAVSAAFWCVFGALLFLFIQTVLHALQRIISGKNRHRDKIVK